MHLLLGTNNPGKAIEIQEGLSGLPLKFSLPSDLGITDDPMETGASFQENALEKALFYFEQSDGHPTVADDSGIIVEALKDELGIHTRRWGAGPLASDEEWIAFFLERMRHEKNRNARFVCNVAFIDAKGSRHVYEGICEGTITDALEAGYLPGLPISACFKPKGSPLVYSAMSVEEKNAVSHRGNAVRALREHLLKHGA